MGAVWMWARIDLRHRWSSTVSLGLMIALVSAVVLTGIAGARRTQSSYDRFLVASRAADVIVFLDEETNAAAVRELGEQPIVEAIGWARTLVLFNEQGDFFSVGGPLDTGIGRTIERPRILEGRRADPNAVDEIVIGEPLARRQGLEVGDHFEVDSYSPERLEALAATNFSEFPPGDGPSFDLEVVGISRVPSDLSLQGEAGGLLFPTPAFTRRYKDQIGSFVGDVVLARLRDPVGDQAEFVRLARERFGDNPNFGADLAAIRSSGVQQAVDVLAIGAAAFALVAAIAGFAAIALVLRRRIDAGSSDLPVLGALGLPRAQRALAVGAPVLPAAVVGALLGVAGAWVASPVFPMGIARQAEPDPGAALDGLVLGLGVVAVVGSVVALVAVLAWRSARATAAGDQASSRLPVLARALEGAPLGPTATIGVRMALSRGRGRTAVPARAALVGTAAAVLGVVGVSVFGASLSQLGGSPERYGFPWDRQVYERIGLNACSGPDTTLTRVRGVGDVAILCRIDVEVEGRSVAAFGLTSVRGDIGPTIVAGRAPRSRHEVALGAETLDAIGREIGDRVDVRGQEGTRRARIVGAVAIAGVSGLDLDDDRGDPLALADGAFFTGDAINRLYAGGSREIAIRFAPGADPEMVTRRILGQTAGDGSPRYEVNGPATPLEIRRLQQVDALPFVLAGFLALLGVVAVGFALASSVRRRRRDLAILKTLGFSRHQVSATVAWQATTIAVVGLVVGIPLGVIAGRAIWRVVADDIGVVSTPDVPIALLLGIAVITIALANVVAAVPAWAAARTRPAVVLRSE